MRLAARRASYSAPRPLATSPSPCAHLLQFQSKSCRRSTRLQRTVVASYLLDFRERQVSDIHLSA